MIDVARQRQFYTVPGLQPELHDAVSDLVGSHMLITHFGTTALRAEDVARTVDNNTQLAKKESTAVQVISSESRASILDADLTLSASNLATSLKALGYKRLQTHVLPHRRYSAPIMDINEYFKIVTKSFPPTAKNRMAIMREPNEIIYGAEEHMAIPRLVGGSVLALTGVAGNSVKWRLLERS